MRTLQLSIVSESNHQFYNFLSMHVFNVILKFAFPKIDSESRSLIGFVIRVQSAECNSSSHVLVWRVSEPRFELFVHIWVEMILNTHVVKYVGLVFQRKCVSALIVQKLEQKFDASISMFHVVIEKQRILSSESLGLYF